MCRQACIVWISRERELKRNVCVETYNYLAACCCVPPPPLPDLPPLTYTPLTDGIKGSESNNSSNNLFYNYKINGIFNANFFLLPVIMRVVAVAASTDISIALSDGCVSVSISILVSVVSSCFIGGKSQWVECQVQDQGSFSLTTSYIEHSSSNNPFYQVNSIIVGGFSTMFVEEVSQVSCYLHK